MPPLATVHHGDALAVLRELPTASVDAVITDPPYSSGGMMRSDRTAGTVSKYLDAKTAARYVEFSGDNRDARSWSYWMALWLGEALRITKPGGVLVMFSDWRQLPSATDALQAGGWIWRGVVTWQKPDARPQRGRFTAACEFAVWGTNGPRPMAGPCLPGHYVAQAPRPRQHPTEKPLEVMRQLVRIAPPGGVVLDPFAGAGTTGVAALAEGRQFIGVELVDHYHAIAAQRVREAVQDYQLPPDQLGLMSKAQA